MVALTSGSYNCKHLTTSHFEIQILDYCHMGMGIRFPGPGHFHLSKVLIPGNLGCCVNLTKKETSPFNSSNKLFNNKVTMLHAKHILKYYCLSSQHRNTYKEVFCSHLCFNALLILLITKTLSVLCYFNNLLLL